MNKTKHTNGPWEAVRNTAFWEIVPVNAGQDGVPFHVGDVCASAPGEPDSGLQEANARLIAAAPDLLEALRGLLDVYLNDQGYLPEVEQKARSAISRATGES
jgi:hypothetical protein